MFEGVLVFLALAAAALAGEAWLIARLDRSHVNIWLLEHLYLPALRMPALIGFVLGAYPSLYGLETAPPLASLLDFDWFGQALNLLFVLPLLFSLLPVAGRLAALALPVQGMALTALLFAPLAAALHVQDPSYWPNAATWLTVAGFSTGGYVVGNALSRRVPQRDHAVPVQDAIILLFQAPAIFAYGRALGAGV